MRRCVPLHIVKELGVGLGPLLAASTCGASWRPCSRTRRCLGFLHELGRVGVGSSQVGKHLRGILEALFEDAQVPSLSL